jgi:hypothetical protein
MAKTPEEILQETQESVAALKDAFDSLGANLRANLNRNLIDADATTKQLTKKIKFDLTSSINNLGKSSGQILENQNKLNKGQLTSKDINKQIENLKNKQKLIQIDLQNALQNELITLGEKEKLQNNLNAEIDEGLNKLEEQRKKAEEIKKAMGNLGSIVKGLNKIPILGGLIDSEKVLENIQEAAAKQGANRFTTLKAGLNSLGKSLVKGLVDPLTILAFIVSKMVEAEKQIIALNRSLVITRGEAFLIREQFVEQSRAINDTAISTTKLLEAQSKLSDALGVTRILSQGINQEFINLTQKVKISEEAAIGLSKITLATGKNARQITINTVGAIEKVKQETKLRLDNRKILEQTGKVSGQLLANFKANPAAIAEAIAKTQALGTTLEQTKSQAESLLNFESSIENELKAELITGKQINLERARMAALMGDQKAVAEELSAQAVDFNTFSEMNVIAQKSLAEALGLSADALSDQLFKQQYLNKSREEILALGGKEALQRMEQLTSQEKFNNAVDKLKDLLGNLVAGPLGLMLSLLSDALQVVTLIGAPFRLIGDAINGILGPANTFGSILKGILFTVIGIMTFMNPIKGLLSLAALGGIILGVETLMGNKKQKEFASGGIVTSEINNATIGEAGPEAIIPLSSPRAAGMLGTDLTPMINAIKEVKASVDRLYNKDTSIKMDSNKVGSTLVQNSYKLA